MNTFKKEEKPKKKKKEAGKVSKSLSSIFSGNFLSKDNVAGSVSYILFLTFLGIMYIANGFNAEQIVRDLDNVGDELKEMRSEYITIKSDLNYKSKQSQVAQATIELGINESTTPPSKIIVDDVELEKMNTEN